MNKRAWAGAGIVLASAVWLHYQHQAEVAELKAQVAEFCEDSTVDFGRTPKAPALAP